LDVPPPSTLAGRLPALANRLDYLRIDHRRRRAVQVGIAWDLIWIGAPEQLAVRQAPSRMKRASVDQGHRVLSTDRNRERSRNNPAVTSLRLIRSNQPRLKFRNAMELGGESFGPFRSSCGSSVSNIGSSISSIGSGKCFGFRRSYRGAFFGDVWVNFPGVLSPAPAVRNLSLGNTGVLAVNCSFF
jgi:hypothetical protein